MTEPEVFIHPWVEPEDFIHPCATEEELRGYARSPTLDVFEIVALMQGFMPRTRSGGPQYMDDYREPIALLLAAVERGELGRPATPRELTAWATARGVAFPEPFVDEVTKNTPRASRCAWPHEFTDELLRLPAAQGRERRRGLKLRGQEPDIGQLAKAIAIAHVQEHGSLPRKADVDRKLHTKSGRSEADLCRRYTMRKLLSPAEMLRARSVYRARKRAELLD